ncbi:uncharacterized protein LOC117642391 isoform X3 [Thrips palmi]|uniref:Uncharacterized protein LOC117642391 isoform X3 n=1 Tax=Thrips palmi TaxID=161013 RepID=A0A6P8ZK34_THRPL|nr:uncharacterized protein LOC117642391 isoform X3 [Thrips palmi]
MDSNLRNYLRRLLEVLCQRCRVRVVFGVRASDGFSSKMNRGRAGRPKKLGRTPRDLAAIIKDNDWSIDDVTVWQKLARTLIDDHSVNNPIKVKNLANKFKRHREEVRGALSSRDVGPPARGESSTADWCTDCWAHVTDACLEGHRLLDAQTAVEQERAHLESLLQQVERAQARVVAAAAAAEARSD